MKDLKSGIPIYESNGDITPIVPMTYTNERTLIATMLREEGVYVNPVLSPAVNRVMQAQNKLCRYSHRGAAVTPPTHSAGYFSKLQNAGL